MSSDDEGPNYAPSPLVIASAMKSSCREVQEFINQVVRPFLVAAPNSDRKFALLGQLLRVLGWLGTLGKLDHPTDFQAVLCAERSLFETAIDIALLSHDEFPPVQMLAWEDSAKLKQAELGTRFFQERGLPVPPEFVGFALRIEMKEEIQTQRKALGWERHPDRWTGPNRDLLQDARLADKRQAEFGFEKWYETEYRQVCWTVHGAGLAMRGLDVDGYPQMIALSLRNSGDLAAASTVWVLKGMNALSEAMQSNVEVLHHRRIVAAARCLGLEIPAGIGTELSWVT